MFPAEFEREIDALIACGYAEHCWGIVEWTDKIASVMRAEHCWVDPKPPIKLSPDALERVNRLVQDRNPIAAMVVVREATGAGLLECRTYVDEAYQAEQRELRARPAKTARIVAEADWRADWRDERRLVLLLEPEIRQWWARHLDRLLGLATAPFAAITSRSCLSHIPPPRPATMSLAPPRLVVS